MGSGASIPDVFTKEMALEYGGELFSDQRFESFASTDDGTINKELILELSKKTDCFLSHNWGVDHYERNNHERVSRVNNFLKSRGLITWFDSEKMDGNIVDKMSEGIDCAQVVVVFITKRYIEKVAGNFGSTDNCKLEFSYAARKKGIEKIIPVIMEEQVRNSKEWNGELGFTIGGSLYIDMVSDERFESGCNTLYQCILKLIRPLKNGLPNKNSGENCAHELRLAEHVPSGKHSTIEFVTTVDKAGSYKPLAEVTVDEVSQLLDALNFSTFKTKFVQNEIDGSTLAACETWEDVVSIGVQVTPKAKALFKFIEQYKISGVPRSIFEISTAGSSEMSNDTNRIAEDALAAHTNSALHRGDRDKTYYPSGECWHHMDAYDWVDTPRGHVCDANRSVAIGVTELCSTEDQGTAPVLLIKHWDTSQRYDRSKDSPPALWGVAFTAREFTSFVQLVEKSGVSSVFLHREPFTDPSEDISMLPWMTETRWIVEQGKVCGISISVRCTQDEHPQVAEVRFRVRGERFEKVSVRHIVNEQRSLVLRTKYAELMQLALGAPLRSGPPEAYPPLATDKLVSYERAVAGGIEQDGFGPDFLCDLWMFARNPLTESAMRIIITSARVDPTCWYIRISNDTEDITGTYTIADPYWLRREAYRGVAGGIFRHELSLYGANCNCNLWLLIDSSGSKMPFAIEAQIITGTSSNSVNIVDFLRLDFNRIVSES